MSIDRQTQQASRNVSPQELRAEFKKEPGSLKTLGIALMLALTALGAGCAGPVATARDWEGETIDSSTVSLGNGVALVSAVPIGSNGQVSDPSGRSQIVVFKSILTQHPDIRGLMVSSSKATSSGSMENFAADWQLPRSGVVADNAASLAQAVSAADDAVTTVLIKNGQVIQAWSNRVALSQEIDAALEAALAEPSVPPSSAPTTAS
jgi:hypothetical protein